MDTYRLKLRTVTPVHIGGGEHSKLNKQKYIFDKEQKKIHVINENKFVNFLIQTGKLDSYIEFLKKASKENSIKTWLDEVKVKVSDYNKFAEYILDIKDMNYKTFNDIIGFVKNQFLQPYIPGSSIKGSLRTYLITSELIRNRKNFCNEWEKLNKILKQNGISNDTIKQLITEIEFKALHLMNDFGEKKTRNDPLNSIMRGIKIGDSSPAGLDRLFLSQKKDYNLHIKKTGRISVFREFLVPETEMEILLSVDKFFTTRIGLENLQGLHERIKAVNEYYFSMLSNYKNKSINNLNELNKKQILLCLGGGTGFYYKSLVYFLAPKRDAGINAVKQILQNKFRKHNHQNDNEFSPRAIKLVEYKGQDYFPGWVSLEGI